MESPVDRRESLVTVSLSDSSSVSSYSPTAEASDHGQFTPHSSITPSFDIPETPVEEDASDFDDTESLDWDGLERTECQESQDSVGDESTVFLLARLERENARFVRDPKALFAASQRRRPLSVDHLRQLVAEQNPLTESMLSGPPMLTDLEFWAALVADYPRTASRLPFLLSKKIKGGVPPPIRGLVWQSMAGASDPTLESLFNALIAEPSPYDKVINRDLHRTFPQVEMFRERGGRGQIMLGTVLRAFSLYDMQVGYCQGLAFLVGPLLMHMDERAAFCVLVRLMEEYDLRTMFTADMAGLHLRIFQFTHMLRRSVPAVYEHIEALGIQSIYATQWFLSFFAVTCPLNMLLRIYDVIFAEGALETLMRVAIAVMQANQERILKLQEEDEILQLLLSRSLWEVYDDNADTLISDAMSLTTVATRDVLEDLEQLYKAQQSGHSTHSTPESPNKTAIAQASELQAAASRFLGRIWSNVGASTPAAPSGLPGRVLRRQSSRSSLTSTINSLDFDDGSQFFRHGEHKQHVDLHNQIEDLLVALNTLQKQHVASVEELEAEKRAREEERHVIQRVIATLPEAPEGDQFVQSVEEMKIKFEGRADNSQRLLTFKDLVQQLEASRSETAMEKERTALLRRDLDSKCIEVRDLKDQLFEIKGRYQDTQREKSKLERTLNEVRQRQQVIQEAPAPAASDLEYFDPPSPTLNTPSRASPSQGLRELRLGRQNQIRQASYSKRSSSLFLSPEDVALALAEPAATPAALASSLTVPTSPPTNIFREACECESLRMELAAAKTGEAVARQELEETKNMFEQLKRSTSDDLVPQRSSMTRQSTAPPSMQSASSPDAQGGGWSRIGKFGWSR